MRHRPIYIISPNAPHSVHFSTFSASAPSLLIYCVVHFHPTRVTPVALSRRRPPSLLAFIPPLFVLHISLRTASRTIITSTNRLQHSDCFRFALPPRRSCRLGGAFFVLLGSPQRRTSATRTARSRLSLRTRLCGGRRTLPSVLGWTSWRAAVSCRKPSR